MYPFESWLSPDICPGVVANIFLVYLLQCLFFQLFLLFIFKGVPCKQHMVCFFFLIQRIYLDKLIFLFGYFQDCQLFCFQFSSVASYSLWPYALQHACPSPTPGACSNSCPLSQWCHPTISSSAVPFSSCLQSFPASESFPMSQFFTSDGQSFGIQLQHQSFQWIFRSDFL